MRIFTGPRCSGCCGVASLSSGPPVTQTVNGSEPERTASATGSKYATSAAGVQSVTPVTPYEANLRPTAARSGGTRSGERSGRPPLPCPRPPLLPEPGPTPAQPAVEPEQPPRRPVQMVTFDPLLPRLERAHLLQG